MTRNKEELLNSLSGDSKILGLPPKMNMPPLPFSKNKSSPLLQTNKNKLLVDKWSKLENIFKRVMLKPYFERWKTTKTV